MSISGLSMQKLFYIANIRFPTERAHGIQVAKMCEAFSREGAKVTLLVPDRKTLHDDPFSYYGIERIFTIEKISVPDTVSWGSLGFLVESFLFAYRAARRVQQERECVVYTREEFPLLFLEKGIRAFYEAHQFRGRMLRRLCKRALGIFSISQGLKDALVAAGYPAEKIAVAHDGFDAQQFSETVSKEEARRRLLFSTEQTSSGDSVGTSPQKIVMYIGGLEAWKGAETLFKAAGSLAEQRIVVAVIGGTPHEIARVRPLYPHVVFLGARPYRELPVHQQAADALVIPNSARAPLSRTFASPLKLFAHMASGIPLIVSDVPALREVVGPESAFLFTPDDPQSLARAVQKVLQEPAHAHEKALFAKEKVTEYTWERRARSILKRIAL